MANMLYNEDDIRTIAESIRTANGKTDTYTVSQMGDAIKNIQKICHVTITEDLLSPFSYTILSGDEFVKEHFNDDGFFAILLPMTPVAYGESGKYKYFCMYHGNIILGTSSSGSSEYCGMYLYASGSMISGGSLSRKSNYTTTTTGLRINENGDVNLHMSNTSISSTYLFSSGDYLLLLGMNG